MSRAAPASAHQRPTPIPRDADDRARGGHPVRLLHVGVREENLVVEPLGEWQLHPSQDVRADPGVDHRGDHQPSGPEGLAEELRGADRRVLGANEPHRRVLDQEQTDGEQRDGGGEVADGGGAAVDSVRVPRGGRLPGASYGDEEGERRNQGQRCPPLSRSSSPVNCPS